MISVKSLLTAEQALNDEIIKCAFSLCALILFICKIKIVK